MQKELMVMGPLKISNQMKKLFFKYLTLIQVSGMIVVKRSP